MESVCVIFKVVDHMDVDELRIPQAAWTRLWRLEEHFQAFSALHVFLLPCGVPADGNANVEGEAVAHGLFGCHVVVRVASKDLALRHVFGDAVKMIGCEQQREDPCECSAVLNGADEDTFKKCKVVHTGHDTRWTERRE